MAFIKKPPRRYRRSAEEIPPVLRRFYVMDRDKNPVKASTIEQWWALMGEDKLFTMKVSRGKVYEGIHVRVSTIFTGIDCRVNPDAEGDPILWETMVTGGPAHLFTRKYTSHEAAWAGHYAIWECVKAEDFALLDKL